jgi:hypothetical protein
VNTAVIITNPDLATIWRVILRNGNGTVHVKSPIPQDERPGHGPAYIVDLDALSADQLTRLVRYLASEYGINPNEVIASLDDQPPSIPATSARLVVE